jgi:hypothetical protein
MLAHQGREISFPGVGCPDRLVGNKELGRGPLRSAGSLRLAREAPGITAWVCHRTLGPNGAPAVLA